MDTKNIEETIEFNSMDRGKLSIVKSNKLIEAKYKLTLNEQRLILLMVSMIKPEDEEFKSIRIRVQDLKEILELQRKDLYKEIPKITRKLMSRILEIKDIEKNKLLQIGWLSSAEYLFGEGVVELSFDPKLKPYLLKLKKAFTIYNLQSVLKLRSSYAIRLYELLKQYETIGTRKFEVNELKEILGIGKTEYKLYGDFKRRVILPAQKELKNKTDIYFDFKEVKRGRKVVELIFYIYKNPNFKEIKEEKNNSKRKLANNVLFNEIKLLTNLSEDKITEIFKNYEEDYIKRTFDYTIKLFKEKKIENLTGFFLTGLKENYFKLSPYEEEKLRQQKEKQEQEKLVENLMEELDKLTSDYRKILNENIDRFVKNLSKQERKNLEEKFKKFISKNSFLKSEFDKKGFDSKRIKVKFKSFILNEFIKNIDGKYSNFIDYLKDKKFNFKKLSNIKEEHKNIYLANLEVLLEWNEKIKSLGLPSNLLLSFVLPKDRFIEESVENKVYKYLYENLSQEELKTLEGKTKEEIIQFLKEKYNL